MDFMDGLNVSLSKSVRGLIPELVALRRRLHQYPEIGFREHRTQSLVRSELESYGIESRPVGETGVVAEIEGETPGKVLLLRADMDALPIAEQGELPFKSANPGVMHACGHDAHTAMLLAAARLIRERGLEKGTVKLMFQPAEEGLGGALRMIREGVLENPKVDGALGFHVWSGFDVGKIATVDGAVAASVDGFRIVIEGVGTHAATPEDGVDPVIVAAQLVTAAQALLTRRISARQPVVLSFTAIRAGNVFNIVPESAEILGTFRTLDAAVRSRLRSDLEGLARRLAETFGASASYETICDHKPTVNDRSMTELAGTVAKDMVGAEGIHPFVPPLVGEDFSEVLDRVPGVFVILGCRSDVSKAVYPHHHPRFTIDERVLPIGVECAVRFVERFLSDPR